MCLKSFLCPTKGKDKKDKFMPGAKSEALSQLSACWSTGTILDVILTSLPRFSRVGNWELPDSFLHRRCYYHHMYGAQLPILLSLFFLPPKCFLWLISLTSQLDWSPWCSCPWPHYTHFCHAPPQFLHPKCGAARDYQNFSLFLNYNKFDCKNISLFSFELEIGVGAKANIHRIQRISEWNQSLFVYCSTTSHRWWQVRIFVGNIEFPACYSKDLGP